MKKITQDIIPPKRSIRNVEFPSKLKRAKEVSEIKKEPVRVAKVKEKLPETLEPKPVYTYEYNEPVKSSSKKKLIFVAVSLLLLGIAFGVSAFFKSAEIKVTPKSETRVLTGDFVAKKNNSGGLAFQIVTTTKVVEKNVVAGTEEKVEKKARGTIVIYNNYSAQAQKLVATTRFMTPEGLIFRLINPISIPGRQLKDGKSVAGSVEATVEADKVGESFNIDLKDFTIPGFKGDPKYTSVYGRSKTPMSGGFSGLQKVVTKDVLDMADKQMEDQLKSSLSKTIATQIPENFVLYKNSLSYTFEPTTQVDPITQKSTDASGATLQKRATVSAVIFDKGSLSRSIISKVSPDYANDLIKVTNLDALNFTIDPDSNFDLNTSTSLAFSLSGDANLVWFFDENKLKSDLLGLSKKNATIVIGTYKTINEAWITTSPFWNSTIPNDPKKVTLINTLTN